VRFAVGREEVALTRGNDRIVEKKVRLPLRWIKGFSEVQAYQARLVRKIEVSAAEALRFIRALPPWNRQRSACHVVQTGGTLRPGLRAAPGSVRFFGPHRVRVIAPLLPRTGCESGRMTTAAPAPGR